MNQEITTLKNEIAGSESAFNLQASTLATFFKKEINRFMIIKNSTDLTVAELDTISINASKNYLKSLKSE